MNTILSRSGSIALALALPGVLIRACSTTLCPFRSIGTDTIGGKKVYRRWSMSRSIFKLPRMSSIIYAFTASVLAVA